MPRCLTCYTCRSEINHDRPSPLTCRHRRRCACEADSEGKSNQGQNTPARSVSAEAPPQADHFDDEAGRALLKAMEPFPQARQVLIDTVNRILGGWS